jgi:acetolactate synthase small subunit
MHAFHIRYRNTQGTLMRILNAASRRALDLPSVHAEAAGEEHLVSLLLEVNAKQVGQLNREWYSITDVLEVRQSAGLSEDGSKAEWTGPHPPASESAPGQSARAALA